MKKAFTLVELLGVIILLGILGLVVTLSINSSLKESRNKLCASQLEFIKEAANIWASEKVMELGDENNVTLKELLDNGLLNKDEVINPKTNEAFSDDLTVKITKNGNNLNYEVVNNPCS